MVAQRVYAAVRTKTKRAMRPFRDMTLEMMPSVGHFFTTVFAFPLG